MKGTIAETTQTFPKMLILGLNNMLSIMFRPKVSIFVWVWVVSVSLFQTPHVQGHYEIGKQVFTVFMLSTTNMAAFFFFFFYQ